MQDSYNTKLEFLDYFFISLTGQKCIHMLISIPPKYSVAQVVGYMKGKSAIFIARNITGKPRNFVGEHFWARGYYVSTVGLDEEKIRNYIQNQEAEDQRLEQLRLW